VGPHDRAYMLFCGSLFLELLVTTVTMDYIQEQPHMYAMAIALLSSLGACMVALLNIAASVADYWRLDVADRLNMPKLLKASEKHLDGVAAHFKMKYVSHGILVLGMLVDSNGVARLVFGLLLTIMLTVFRKRMVDSDELTNIRRHCYFLLPLLLRNIRSR